MYAKITKTKKTSSPIQDCKTIVIDFVEQYQLLPQQSTVVLGLSGGPDSVFLLHVLTQLKKEGRINTLIAAHLDHGWRPESAQDVLFCKNIATQYDVPFVTAHLNDFKPSIRWNGSKEDFGRRARRLFFQKIMKEHNANAIALAHHRDDQLETFFIRLLRGTSLTGLCGIRPRHGAYIRPLLAVSKEAILAYLKEHSIAYLTDPTNTSTDYLRNRIREQVLPALRSCDSRFDRTSIKTIERLQEVEDYLQTHTHTLFATMQHDGKNTIAFDQLLAQPRMMQYRLLIVWLTNAHVSFPVTETFLREIIRFLKAKKSNEHHIMQRWIIKKEKKYASITPIS